MRVYKNSGIQSKKKGNLKTTETRSFNLGGEPHWGAMLPGRNLTLAKDKGFSQESDIRA